MSYYIQRGEHSRKKDHWLAQPVQVLYVTWWDVLAGLVKSLSMVALGVAGTLIAMGVMG